MSSRQPIVKLENAAVALDGQTILSRLNWSLHEGQSWAIVGPNGSGKSTFLKLVRGDLWPVAGQSTRQFYVDEQWSESPIGWREQTALVSPELQERYVRLERVLPVRYVVQSGFFQGDYHYGKLLPDQREQADQIMELVGITPLQRRDVQTLSTGELRRVLIARALVAKPRCLFLDEFVDGLDPKSRAAVLEAIDAAVRAGTQVLYTTHRRDELIPSLTHLLEMESGGIREQRELKLSKRSSRKKSPALVPFVDPGTGDHVLNIQDCSVFMDGAAVLKDIHWTIRPGQQWAITGHNGAGKSTLAKVASGDLYPRFGSRVSRWNGQRFETIWDLKAKIGYVSAELQNQYQDSITGREVVASGLFSTIGLLSRPTRQQWREVSELFQQFGAADLMQRKVGEISFGQMRKLLFLRALVKNPALLILDEPFDGLDEASRTQFAKIMEIVARKGSTIIIVTHHPDELPPCITHLLQLVYGTARQFQVCRGG